MSEIVKASVCAIKQETTSGVPVVPSAAADFLPLRAGVTLAGAVEELTSDELVNSLGASKSYSGKENPTGSHPIYLKHSETEGVSPDWALFLQSALGAKTSDAPVEYNTVSSSTTSVVKVDTGEGALFQVGKALLVKDSTNGYAIRNVKSISTDDLSLNFNLDAAPAAGVNLGKPILFSPANSGHPSYTVWMYNGSGGAIQAVAGARTTSTEITLNAGQQAEATFNYAGSQFYFNPINITAANKYLTFTDDSGLHTATLAEGLLKSPVEAARTIQTAIDASSTISTLTCEYANTTGKFTLASDGTTFQLSCNSGASQLYGYLGFDVAADKSLATSYVSDSAISFLSSDAENVLANGAIIPSYDNADNIIVKDNEILIGSGSDTICRKASSISLSITSNVTDVGSVCAATGVYEKLPSSRECSLNATILLEKYEAGLFDKFINNATTQVMVNIGPKSGGNWVAGKCVNIYMGNAAITQHTVGGTEFVIVELVCKGFVTSDIQDIYINLV